MFTFPIDESTSRHSSPLDVRVLDLVRGTHATTSTTSSLASTRRAKRDVDDDVDDDA